MNKVIVCSLLLILMACSGSPTAPTQSKLTINPTSITVPLNTQFCFTATGGQAPYMWSYAMNNSSGGTIGVHSNGCVQSAKLGQITVRVASADGQQATGTAVVR